MANWFIILGLTGISIGVGLVLGKWYASRNEKKMGQKAYEHFEKNDIPMEMLEDITRPEEELDTPIPEVGPAQNLKACWICGKQTIYDICSQEHYQEWVRRTANNNTHMSEPVDHGKKAGGHESLKKNLSSSNPAPKNK